jgi:hypothetical protein
MVDDPLNVVEIETSRPATLFMVGLCIVLATAGGILAAIGAAALGVWLSLIVLPCGAIGSLFFSYCTFVWLRRLIDWRVPITISPDGIRDRRIAAETIPWSAVRKLWTRDVYNEPALMLTIDPAVEKTLHLTSFARFNRAWDRAFGHNGLWMSHRGLKISFDDLRSLIASHVRTEPSH